jgi:hypothetical protein
MYKVAKMALTAGLPGKRTANTRDVQLACSGSVASLCSFNACTTEHCWVIVSIRASSCSPPKGLVFIHL